MSIICVRGLRYAKKALLPSISGVHITGVTKINIVVSDVTAKAKSLKRAPKIEKIITKKTRNKNTRKKPGINKNVLRPISFLMTRHTKA